MDESGTISFLISVLVADTDQMITLPVVIFPTDVSLFEYQARESQRCEATVAPKNSEYFQSCFIFTTHTQLFGSSLRCVSKKNVKPPSQHLFLMHILWTHLTLVSGVQCARGRVVVGR